MTVEYVDGAELHERSRDCVATVSFKGKLRAVRTDGNNWIKLRFATDEEIAMLTEAGIKLGAKRGWKPSGFGDLFHDPFARIPRVHDSIALALPEDVVGAWEEARWETGKILHDAREYDLISAYGWSGLRPLPKIESGWPVYRFSGPGVYRVTNIRQGRYILPPHLRWDIRKRELSAWVTSEEIEELDLKCDVIRGVKFSQWWEPRKRIEEIINAAPKQIWKKVLRSYWGIWAAQIGPTNRIPKSGRTWTLPNPSFNPTFAGYIVSRVRNRLAHEADHAAHLYVDAIITSKKLESGEAIGSWHMKDRFAKIQIHGPGRWVAPVEGKRKHAGGM